MNRLGICVLAAAALAGCGGSDGGGGSGGAGGGASDAAHVTPDMAAAHDAAVSDMGVAADMGVPEGPCGNTPESLRDCVQTERYQQELTNLAHVRDPGSQNWQAAQDRCASEFERLGYRVERWNYGTGTDVIGVLPGTEHPEEQVLVSAHYDSVPRCDGADDNASGAAGVIEAARVLATQRYARTLVVACWDEEERGLIGSSYYAARAKARGDHIVANFVFEMIGYTTDQPQWQVLPVGIDALYPMQYQWIADRMFKGDFIALIGDDINPGAAADMQTHADAIGLPLVHIELANGLRQSDAVGDLRRSDHAPFWDLDYPGIMVTDTSEFRYLDYHCEWGPDAIENVNVDFATKVVRATVGAAASQLGVRPAAAAPMSDAGVPSDAGVVTPPPPACDVVAQDCGAGKKCTPVVQADMSLVDQCVDATGQGAQGAMCTRPTNTVGLDDCGPGLFCALYGLPQGMPQPRQCLKLCTASEQCGDDAFCTSIDETSGVCVPRCDPFTTQCGDGLGCIAYPRIQHFGLDYACGFAGNLAAGAECGGRQLCSAGTDCVTVAHQLGLHCMAYCDDAHACPDGQSCIRDKRDGSKTIGHCAATMTPP